MNITKLACQLGMIMLSCMTPLTASAVLDMNCRKTAYGGTPTLECVFSWWEIDEWIYTQGSMASQVWKLDPPPAENSAVDFFTATSQPDEERTHIVNWDTPGLYMLESTGSLYFCAGPFTVEHPQSGVFDNVQAPLP